MARPPRLSIGMISLTEVLAEFDGEPNAAKLLKLADEVLYNNKVARKAARRAAGGPDLQQKRVA